MKEIEQKLDGYISLKEAAVLSGYAPDYVGQLIRKGKLPGKQVYSNVAWVTTREAVVAYVEESKDARRTRATVRDEGVRFAWRGFLNRTRGEFQAVALYKTALYALIGISVLFSLFLFFLFSVALDAKLTRRADVSTVAPVEIPPPTEQSPL